MSDIDPGGFPAVFNQVIALEPDGSRAHFGLDVLHGLVQGIDEFQTDSQPRWRQFRSMGAALLGSSMWIDDPDLLDRIVQLPSACIVVTKQKHGKPSESKKPTLARLAEVNDTANGLSTLPFRGLSGLMPKIDGRPAVVGPSSRQYAGRLPAIRVAGFRGDKGPAKMLPIVHAKLALLGHTWWHDEDGLSGVDDYRSFTPKRLWISSANFTTASRRSLEFGFWTEDRKLLKAAEEFLVQLIGHSEDLDSDSAHLDPDLAEPDFDDISMAEAAWADFDDDEDA